MNIVLKGDVHEAIPIQFLNQYVSLYILFPLVNYSLD